MSSHPKIEQLSAYVDGELPADERREVTEHLATCPACAEELESLQWVVSFSRGVPDHALPADLRLDEAQLASRPQAEGETTQTVGAGASAGRERAGRAAGPRPVGSRPAAQGQGAGRSQPEGRWPQGPSRWSLGTAAALLMAGFLLLIGGEATRQSGDELTSLMAVPSADRLMSEEEAAEQPAAQQPALGSDGQADPAAAPVRASANRTAAASPAADDGERSSDSADGGAPAAEDSAEAEDSADAADDTDQRSEDDPRHATARALIATATAMAMAAEPEPAGRLNPATMTAVAAEFMPTRPPEAPDTGRAEATPTPEAVGEALAEPTAAPEGPTVVVERRDPPVPQGTPWYRLLGWTLIGLAIVVAGLGFLRA